jgi:hypothetical protein
VLVMFTVLLPTHSSNLDSKKISSTKKIQRTKDVQCDRGRRRTFNKRPRQILNFRAFFDRMDGMVGFCRLISIWGVGERRSVDSGFRKRINNSAVPK